MKRRTGVVLIVLGVLAIFAVLAFLLLFTTVFDQPSYPDGPTAHERANIVTRFAKVRPALEQIVASDSAGPDSDAAENVIWMTHTHVDSLATLIAQPGSPREACVFSGCAGPLYIATWSRRGGGFEGPWWYAGYVYAPAGLPSEVRSTGCGSESLFGGRYLHLDGPWWAFSVDDPHRRWSPHRQRSRAAAISW